jgi:hypothetical protein
MTHISTSQPKAQRRFAPFLVIAGLAAIFGFLEAQVFIATLPSLLIGAAWGLVWTAVAGLVAAIFGRLRDYPLHWPDASALLVAFVTTIMLGAGLILHLMVGSPEAYLALQQSGTDGDLYFYATLNPLTEWVLVPLALFLNWKDPRRRNLVVTAAAIYYAERIATYFYFGPVIASWPNAQPSAELLDEVSLWLTLDWVRIVVGIPMILLFVLVTFLPAPGREGSEKR